MRDSYPLVIACATVAEELRELGLPEERLIVLDFGLHVDPDKLRLELQDRIDGVEGDEDVVLGYGLCSFAVAGLVSRKHRLVVPRVQDCISLFLGSEEERLKRLEEEPGTYFLTKGWIEAGGSAYAEFAGMSERMGEQRAMRVARAMIANYRKMALINTGNYRIEHYREFTRQQADLFDLEYQEIQGSNRLLEKMLDGPWDSEFVVVSPGRPIQRSDFE